MTVSNYKDLLTEGLALPLAVEAKFPNAPKISTYLTKATTNLPTTPNFPTAFPDLPTLPALPDLGITLPGGGPLGGGTLGNGTKRKPMITRVTETYQVIPPRTVEPTPGGGTATFLQSGDNSTFTFK
jgi:hypothetical protein